MLMPCGHCICKASILKIAKVRLGAPGNGALRQCAVSLGHAAAGLLLPAQPPQQASLALPNPSCFAPQSTNRTSKCPFCPLPTSCHSLCCHPPHPAPHAICVCLQATNRTFKCPYCPAECTPRDCQELVFPDMD